MGGSEAFFKRLAPGVGAKHVYAQMYHEIFNEIDAQKVFDDLRAWVQKL
jgi:alpha-beta hydrolase superfamily lysophospholipase